MITRLQKVVEKICLEGVQSRVFSGYAVSVSIKKRGTWERFLTAGGKTGFGANYDQIDTDTFFDLASLTKPLCTVPCLLHLIREKKLDFDTTLEEVLSFHNNGKKKKIKIRNLLSHCSGFAAYKPFFKDFSPQFLEDNKKKLIQTILKDPLVYQTGTETLYSDLDYIVLGEIIELISGTTLDSFFETFVTSPLCLDDSLFFKPLEREIAPQKIAATEKCEWRKRVVQGEVHDEHCFLMGGVAGHAGLFGNISAVNTLCEAIFDQWQGNEHTQALGGKLFQKVFSKRNRKTSWYMGFDTPSPGKSSSGSYFSPESGGHLGFTGTSFWMDPKRKIIVILLTNRVHPSRANIAIRKFRPFFHDVVMQTLLESKI